MGLIKGINRYKRKVVTRFRTQVPRKQFNFVCDKALILVVKATARRLEVPMYILLEHVIQLGMLEVVEIMKADDALLEELIRHLIEGHLLVPATVPMSEKTSRRVHRIKNAMKFLELYEVVNTPDQQAKILKKLGQEYDAHSDE